MIEASKGDNKRNLKGFTIVELLIVIVVIGILAAISIVAYNGIQNRAVQTAINSDLANNAKKLEEFRILNDRYPDYQTEGDWWTEIKSSGLTFSNYRGEYYIAYCVDNSTAHGDWALMIETESGAGNHYRSSSGSGEYTGYTVSIDQVCVDYFGMSAPPELIGIEAWIKGDSNPTWAGGDAW